MQILRHLSRISVTPPTDLRARELGGMAYMQWLGSLSGSADYTHEARRALRCIDASSGGDGAAVDAFRVLLQASLDGPLMPLDLALPVARRRGGARGRRANS